MILSKGYQNKNGTKSLRSKTWMIMKLTIALLLFFTFQVNAKSNAQRITIVKNNIHLSEVFKDIEQQTGFHFFYDKYLIQKTLPIDVVLKDATLNQALVSCLKGQQLTYTIVKNTVVIQSQKISQSASFQIANATALPPPPVEIHGNIKDENGNPLSNASVIIKGTKEGVTTNSGGDFSINIPSTKTVLVISFVGYVTQEITVGDRTVFNIILVKSEGSMDQIVVTALGIRRQVRSLGYSTATVDLKDISQNRTSNFANSLEGKISGVNVSPPASGPGGSSKIRIRGQSSFGGDNSPLIIVDGTPLHNTTSTGEGMSDDGGGLHSINQDDIASMTVLKGATAAALYGFRAKDGAIIITTKHGEGSLGIGVEFNSNFKVSTALDYTDFQYIYGQGENGLRPKTIGDAISSGTWSFGEKLDGVLTPQFDGTQKPYSAHPNKITQFYRPAISSVNTIALSGNTKKTNFRFSFGNTDAASIMPNSTFKNKIFNIGLNHNFTSKLSLRLNANYSKEFNKNPPQYDIEPFSQNTTVQLLANSIDINWVKSYYKNPDGTEAQLSRFPEWANPYWVTNMRFENIKKDRLVGNVLLRYQFNDWLYVQGNVSQDHYTRTYEINEPTFSGTLAAPVSGYNGSFSQSIGTFRELNTNFIMGVNKSFGNIGIDVTLGGNSMDQVIDNLETSVTNFYVMPLYTIANGQIKDPNYSFSHKRVNSLFGAVQFSYKSLLYLSVTGR
ncbi:MAG: carboxypeptidase-like regulatory domain-containing protein, partial [Ginsengibacter sp.]